MEIARQLGMDESGVRRAYDRVLKRIPPADVELLRKLQSERLNDARLFGELLGWTEQVPGSANPGQMKTVTVSSPW